MNPLDWDAPVALIWLALFVIVSCRANATYWLGRALARGTGRSGRLAGLLDSAQYQRASRMLDRWGAPLVAVCFITVGLQTMVLLAAGFTRMRLAHFLPAVAVGCMMWASIYSAVGFIGFRALVALWSFSPLLTCALAGGVLVVLTSTVISQRRARRAGLAGVQLEG